MKKSKKTAFKTPCILSQRLTGILARTDGLKAPLRGTFECVDNSWRRSFAFKNQSKAVFSRHTRPPKNDVFFKKITKKSLKIQPRHTIEKPQKMPVIPDFLARHTVKNARHTPFFGPSYRKKPPSYLKKSPSYTIFYPVIPNFWPVIQ